MSGNRESLSKYELAALRKRIETIQAELAGLHSQLGPKLANGQPAEKSSGILSALGLRSSEPFKLHLDEPAEGAEASAGVQVRVRGWALAKSGIAAVELQIDDTPQPHFAYGLARPDVPKVFPDFAGGDQSGFDFEWDTTGYSLGPHRLVFKVRSQAGHGAEFEHLFTLGKPMRDGFKLFCDEPKAITELEPGSKLKIRGWALALSGVSRMEFQIDDGPVRRMPFGYPRPDVAGVFPEFPEVGESGFEYEIDTTGISFGEHRLIVAAWNSRGESRLLERTILLKAPLPDDVRLYCDFPLSRGCQSVREVIQIRGWAVSWTGIREVQIQIGNMPPAIASYGGFRPDVGKNHPDFFRPDNSGYRFFWDTASVPEGSYEIRITAIANGGGSSTLTRHVLIDQKCHADYSQWIAQNEPTAAERKLMAAEAVNFERSPKISIAVPVYKTPLDLLSRCIDSVLEQIYPNWELCLADDGSKLPEVTELLESYSQRDARIRVHTLEQNRGISAATNAALGMCTGDYVAFLDSDDELADFAVWEVVRAINENPLTDLFYSDEDKMDEGGRRYDAFFKPEWSPEFFFASNYLCHFIVVRRWVMDRVKGLDETYRSGTQDYEFLLRVTECTTNIKRIPKVLYHWRAIQGSTAVTEGEKPEAGLAGLRALSEYMARNCPGATVEEVLPCRYRVRYPVEGKPQVDIIMPTGGKMDLLRRAVEDVLEKTEYREFQIVLIDNSQKNQVELYATTMAANGAPIRYMDWRKKRFNFSVMNNEAIRRSTAPYILFLNDDMSIISSEWLTAMLEHAQRPEIGAVGAQLWYPNNTIQHAGVVMGIFGNSSHAFKELRGGLGHYFHFPNMTRNCSAVTAACLLMSREKFWEVDGFDEKNLSVAFQDVDLCLKLLEKGYRNVYTPHALLYHYESATKTEVVPNLAEDAFTKRKWQRYIVDDPYYNPNLTRQNEHFGPRLT